MRRASFAAALAAAVLLSASAFVPAQAEWPNDRPIRLIVGFGAGGGTDIVARIVAQPLAEKLGQSVLVENKPGAGGAIAGEQVVKSDKDGYTATMISAGHTVSAAMVKAVKYDAVKDFAPVALVADSAFVVVARKDFPANDLKGLIALAKASPGKLNIASVGLGSTQHMAGELITQSTGIDVKHIPFRNTPGVVAALLGKEVDYAVESLHSVRGQVEAGELKLLAVCAPQRWSAIPNVPTVAESGIPGYAVSGWYGWFYPAGTPQPIVDKTLAALTEIVARPEIKAQMEKAGTVARLLGPDEFGKHVAGEVAKWQAVRDKAGLTPQ
jgi:tripartite-type tricarboxylate transporter receptor subunit TctC